MKICSDAIGNRNRVLPDLSAVLQPTAPSPVTFSCPMLLNPKPALSCSIASLPCVAQSQQCPKLLNPTLPYIAQSQPCFTLLNTNPCSFPVSCKTARCSVGSMEVWQGKRISRKAAGSTAPPLKKAPSKADVT